MYQSIQFPTVATEVVIFDGFSVSIDPTFACVVVEQGGGYDVFTYDEAASSFVFVCSTCTDKILEASWSSIEKINEALKKLFPWLVKETVMVRTAWFEFFAGERQLPSLRANERELLADLRMRVVAGVPVLEIE